MNTKKVVSKTSYINRMLPHLLSVESKKLKITPNDKREWRKLVEQIKAKLTDRYLKHFRYESYILENDISYNKKNYIPKQAPQKPVKPVFKSNELNDKIINSLSVSTNYKREWIRNSRMELIHSLRTDELILTSALVKQGIKVYNKMPFIIDNKIIFADLYLPEYRIIIEISNKYKKSKSDRFSKLESTNNTLIVIDYNKIKDKNYVHNFIYNMIERAIKYND